MTALESGWVLEETRWGTEGTMQKREKEVRRLHGTEC